ncbi:hypothetical protein [Arthrobacter sp. R-11]|uniref:hypothetical protein n=1 Tax=Arthrobacter sp. R-11 TaxID=3404053 RepID=UPI003CF44D0E
MRKRMWGFGILGAGAVAALVAATVPPATPDPAGLPATAPDYAIVKPATHAQPGIVEKTRGYVDESGAAFEARMAVTTECMARAGFPDFPKTELSHRDPGLGSFLYGFSPMDVPAARKTGYPYLKGREVYMPDAIVEAYSGKAGAQKSFSGGTRGGGTFMTGGCQLKGIEAVYGAGNDYAAATAAYSLILPGTESAKFNPAFKAALNDWSACMAKAGYGNMKDPGQASLVASQQSGHVALKIAVADATCREQVQLEKRLEDVAAPYLTTVVADKQSELDNVARIRAAADTRAAALGK